MANLAEAVDATETDWIISADLDDDIDFLTVEDEIVHVTANFPAQYQLGEGTTSVPRIRVERGAGGTTAASHADTTALTPLIPPAAAAGAGGVTVDNQSDPPAEVTTIIAPGAVIVGDEVTLPLPDPTGAPDGQVPTTASGVYSLETLPKDFYAQDDDPGAVGQGSIWKDTLTDLWWTRNPANTAWLPRAQTLVQSSGAANALATAEATATGSGTAIVSRLATAGDGVADATSAATTDGDGGALAGPQASTSGLGNADASPIATASGTGDATVFAQATASAGVATAGAAASDTLVSSGMKAVVVAGVAQLGFNAVMASPIAIPVIPAVPTEQDIADVLVALGLATQTP